MRQAAAVLAPKLRPAYEEHGITIRPDATTIQWLPVAKEMEEIDDEAMLAAWKDLRVRLDEGAVTVQTDDGRTWTLGHWMIDAGYVYKVSGRWLRCESPGKRVSQPIFRVGRDLRVVLTQLTEPVRPATGCRL